MPVVGITHSSRKVLPGTPTIGTATDVGTNRAYNDGAIDVAFTPADLNATLYTASAYDNLAAATLTATGTSSPIRITGFRSSASTTATVVASNAIGSSSASAASNPVTVTTVPIAPSTIGTLAVNGAGSLVLNTWGSVTNSSPTNGGKTISAYRARLFPGSISSSTGDLASPGTTVWNSLTPGNSYTANGYAVNANGESAASPSSNSATVGQAPTLSTNPSFTASANQVTLSSGTWTNSPTSYTYQIATSLANLNAGTYVLNSTTTSTSATYTGSYSTTYYGKVTATNAYGSATSGNFTASTGAAPDLSPQNYVLPTLTAASATGNAASNPYDNLTCSAGSWTYSPTSYTYYLYSASTGSLIGSSSATSATSFVFADTMGYNIDYSTSYYARVSASNANGGPNLSNASNTATTAAYYVPPTPTGTLSVSNITSSQCTATFTVSNAASWNIIGAYVGGAFYISGTNSSSPVTVTSLPAGANGVNINLNMYTGAGLTGTLYQVSNQINVPAAASAPSTPTGLVNTYSSGPSWTGSWTASTGTAPITYYWELEQAASSGGTITAFASGSTTGTSFTQSMSSSNGLWARFKVVASNSVGSSGTATSGWA